MFQYANELLQTADAQGEKVFLFMLSMTNHPPYETPQGYSVKPVDPQRLPEHRTKDLALARSILETYQYANDSLGGFLDRLNASGLAARSVIAITGDHNTRSIFEYPDSGNLDRAYGVPILFHIPEPWRTAPPILNQWASHRDIFPTLHEIVLGIAPSGLAGRNLYANQTDLGAIGFMQTGAGKGLAISEAGAVLGVKTPQYFEWQDGTLVATEQPGVSLQQLANRARAGVALADWRVREGVLK